MAFCGTKELAFIQAEPPLAQNTRSEFFFMTDPEKALVMTGRSRSPGVQSDVVTRFAGLPPPVAKNVAH